MELTHGTNQKTFNSKQEEIIHPKETGDDLTCNKLEIKTKSSTELDDHIHEEHTIEPCLEELTCRQCSLDVSSAEEVERHLKTDHQYKKCNNCDFSTQRKGELMAHISSTHINVSVEVHKIRLPNIQILSCDKCEYTCTLNRQMKTHVKQKHIQQDGKYKCNFCNFQANVNSAMYEHKFELHPEIDNEFGPQNKSSTSRDFILNLLAEQNIALIEEVLNLKKDFKDFKTQVSNSIVEVKEQTKSCLSEIVTTFKSNEDKPVPHSTAPPSEPAKPKEWSEPDTVPKNRRKSQIKPKTAYQARRKVLYVTDSVGRNIEFPKVELETKCTIKTAKAYSAAYNKDAKWPHLNFNDVVNQELTKQVYDTVVMTAPTLQTLIQVN